MFLLVSAQVPLNVIVIQQTKLVANWFSKLASWSGKERGGRNNSLRCFHCVANNVQALHHINANSVVCCIPFALNQKSHVPAIPGLQEYVGAFTDEGAWGEDGYLADKGVNVNTLIGPVEDPAGGHDAAWGIRAKLAIA